MREYLSVPVEIDGRAIPYTVVHSVDYFAEHDKVPAEELDAFTEANPEIDRLVSQIIALKQSCFLLRHTTHSCQSLSDDLYVLKERLIKELKDEYDYTFDDEWMEQLVPESYDDIVMRKIIEKSSLRV